MRFFRGLLAASSLLLAAFSLTTTHALAQLPVAPAAQTPRGVSLPPGVTPAQTGSSGLVQTTLAPPPGPSPDPRQVPPAKPGALTLDQVLTLAEHDNPTLLAARQNLASVQAQEIEAGLRQNPNLGVTGSDVTLSASNPANPYSYSLQISRLFERGQKRRWRLDSARASTIQTAAQLHDQERATRLAVSQAFTDMLVAKAALALADANLADFRRELKINYDRYQAGDLGKLDYERLDLQLAQFESDQSAAEINLGQAGDQLQTLLGISQPKQDFDITGDIVPPTLTEDLTGLETGALAARPDYQAALAGVQVADANVKLAYANGTTDPTLEGEYDRTASYNSAGFNINIPLRIFDRNQGNKQTSRFLAESSRLNVTAARNQVYSDVDQAWIGYTRSKALSERYSGHYLDEAADVLSIAQFAYEHGGIALIDYLDALRDSRQTTSDALQAYAATWLAIHQLSYASATPLLH
jgi:cobalt-zinc-cadmium efflux system outer membrane protein